MLKKTILSFLLLLPLIAGYGQKFQGGLTGGINAARIDGDSHELYGKLGLNAGAFVAREITGGSIFWQMELKYTSRGKYNVQRDPSGTIIGTELKDIRYIEMPLSIQYFLKDRISVGAGLSPDVLIYEYNADENGELPIESAPDLDRFGLTVFFDVNFYAMEKLAFGIRFNYSVYPFYRFDGYAVRYRDRGFFHDVLSVNAKYYLTR